jgi:hypothetical protein
MSHSSSPQTRLVVEYLSPTLLKPDPRNPRSHDKRQITQIAASMREFGFTNPILVDEDHVVIAGHGRLLAAKQIDQIDVPVIRLAGLSETQKRALRLADNKLALNSGWDTDLLRIELEAIADLSIDFDVSLIGFSAGEIDVLLSASPMGDPDDEAIPEVSAEPRTRLGDIWALGDHRVGCGDVRDKAFLEEVMGLGTLADAAFLDPPYNVRIKGHANVKSRHREFAMASGEMNHTEFTAFLTESLGASAAVSRDGAVHYVCMDWRHMDEMLTAGRAVYGDLLNVCVWNKSNGKRSSEVTFLV